MSTLNKFKEEIIKEYPRLKKEDTFKFRCHPGVPCFNKCCNDVNIFLTPYDIIRLKNRLKMHSSEFLGKYTLLPIEENLKHPIIMLKMNEDDMNCPFVSKNGCTVYEDRPWACRMYPLGVASPKENAANNDTESEDGSGKSSKTADEEFYFLLQESVCKGFEEEKEWKISDWLNDQDVSKHNEMGELFKDISLHNHFLKGKYIEPVKMEMFYMACYDIDKFRDFVFKSTFLNRFYVDRDRVELMRKDDEELQRFAFEWVRYSIFNEKTIELREDYLNKS